MKQRLAALARALPGAIHEPSGIGAMWSFVPFDGSAAAVEAVIRAALEEGLLVFSAGAEPARLRLLLPVNLTNAELESGFKRLRRALARVAEERA